MQSPTFLTIDDLTRALDNKLQVDVAILDLKRHLIKFSLLCRLHHKLHYHALTGDLLQWIQSFLTNHVQSVFADGTCASPCCVTSGIPLGSVSGPVLFPIYINDITSNIRSQLRPFADGCLFYHPVNLPDHKILQDDLLVISIG